MAKASITVTMSAILNIRRTGVEGQCSLRLQGFFHFWFFHGVFSLFVLMFLIFRSYDYQDLSFPTRELNSGPGQ